MSELRILRDRQQDLDDEIDRARERPTFASRTLLVKTATVNTYPTSAAAFYAVIPQSIAGPETEGAGATFADNDALIYAYNTGSAVPPNGTKLLAHSAGNGKFSFRFDG